MPIVWIPASLRALTNRQETVRVAGATVRDVIEHLEAQFPGIRSRLCDGDNLRPGLVVALDSEVSRLGLAQAVGANSEVHFLPALGGG